MASMRENNDSFLAAWPPVGGILWLGRNKGAELPHLCGRVDSGQAARVNNSVGAASVSLLAGRLSHKRCGDRPYFPTSAATAGIPPNLFLIHPGHPRWGGELLRMLQVMRVRTFSGRLPPAGMLPGGPLEGFFVGLGVGVAAVYQPSRAGPTGGTPRELSPILGVNLS